MRRYVGGLVAALTASALVLAGGSPASAQCPGSDGTVPGSSATTEAYGTGGNYTTIYIDDRDFADADDDGDAGGLWLYIEENSTGGLQRGGDQVVFRAANPQIPHLFAGGLVILPPDPSNPVRPTGLTLFPDNESNPGGGVGGGSVAEEAGSHDDCIESSTPDGILF